MLTLYRRPARRQSITNARAVAQHIYFAGGRAPAVSSAKRQQAFVQPSLQLDALTLTARAFAERALGRNADFIDAGLAPGDRIERYNATYAAGFVARTDPAAGTVVAPGTAIDYVVSKGPEPTPTPAPTPRPTGTPTLLRRAGHSKASAMANSAMRSPS